MKPEMSETIWSISSNSLSLNTYVLGNDYVPGVAGGEKGKSPIPQEFVT